MTLGELKKIVNANNRNALRPFRTSEDQESDSAGQVVEAEGPDGDSVRTCYGCFDQFAEDPCFCGWFRSGWFRKWPWAGLDPVCGRDLAELVLLEDVKKAPGRKARVRIGTVIHSTNAKPNLNEPRERTVLLIGINYGQDPNGTEYLRTLRDPPTLFANGPFNDTRMAGKAEAALQQFRQDQTNQCALDVPKEGKYWLVAANFFPWITRGRWRDLKLNSIQESLFVHCHGYPDPFAHIVDLVQRMGSELAVILFHGANNIVPYLGAEFVRRYAGSVRCPPAFAFTDNLAPPDLLYNVFRLTPRSIGRHILSKNFAGVGRNLR